MYGTDAPVLDFFFAEHVGDPIYISAVVHVLVHVQVAVVGGLLLHHGGGDTRAQNVHHLGQGVLARKQRDGVRAIGRVFGLACLEVHQEPRRCGLGDGVPPGVQDGIVLEAHLVLVEFLGPGGNGNFFAPQGNVQNPELDAGDDGGVARLHHFPEAETVSLGVGDGGFFHEQEQVGKFQSAVEVAIRKADFEFLGSDFWFHRFLVALVCRGCLCGLFCGVELHRLRLKNV